MACIAVPQAVHNALQSREKAATGVVCHSRPRQEIWLCVLSPQLTLGLQALKGGNEDEVDAMLDRVMMLFRYLQEKDVFEKYYKQHLAKRLLSGRAVSPHTSHHLLCFLKQSFAGLVPCSSSQVHALAPGHTGRYVHGHQAQA